MNPHSEYLTLQEAADLLGKSTQTVRRLIKRGELTAQRIQTPQGFQYAVLRNSLAGRPMVAPFRTEEMPSPNPIASPAATPVPEPMPAPSHEPEPIPVPPLRDEPEMYLENDYFVLQPSPVQNAIQNHNDGLETRQLMELVHMAHKEKVMLITILERLQAELEQERKRPKGLFQWVRMGFRKAKGHDANEDGNDN